MCTHTLAPAAADKVHTRSTAGLITYMVYYVKLFVPEWQHPALSMTKWKAVPKPGEGILKPLHAASE